MKVKCLQATVAGIASISLAMACAQAPAFAQSSLGAPAANTFAEVVAESGSTVQFTFASTEDATLLTIPGSPGLELRLVNGHFEVESSGLARNADFRFPIGSDRTGHFNDGHSHTVALRMTSQATTLYVDGQYAHSTTAVLVDSGIDVHNAQLNPAAFNLNVTDQALSGEELQKAFVSSALFEIQQPIEVSATKPLENYYQQLPEGFAESNEGTLFVEFETTSSGVVSLISFSDTKAESTNLTLALNNGDLVVENRNNGQKYMAFTVGARLNDGQKHNVALRIAPWGSVVYINGREAERHSQASYVNGLAGVDGLWLGGNTDSRGQEWMLRGVIRRAAVYDVPLSDEAIAGISNAPIHESTPVFDSGLAGSQAYRIPSLVKLESGRLLAAADQRTSNPYDSPNHIQTAVRLSDDQGATWSDPIVAIEQPGSGRSGASVIDTAIVQNRENGEVVMVVDHFPGGVGQAQARAGIGFDEQGNQILTNKAGETFLLTPSGEVIDASGQPTAYEVAQDGATTLDGREVGNIHLQNSDADALSEYPTAYLVVSTSSDDGETWSQPRDITSQVKKDWMRFIGTGPGSAIQIAEGAHAGRIIVPVYYNSNVAPNGVYSSAVIYSDDGGENWSLGGSPNDGRLVGNETIDVATFTNRAAATHEATVVEAGDGRLVMFMRNPGSKVLRSESNDGGMTWSQPEATSASEIFSQPNAISVADPATGAQLIAFSNASKRFPGDTGRRNERGRGVLRLSNDAGQTWQSNRVFRGNTYVYSSMVDLGDGQIGLLWEMEWDGMYFTKVSVDWIQSGGLS